MIGTNTQAAIKEQFLSLLAEGHSVTYSAGLAKVARKTVYNWRVDDPKFAQAWSEALEAGGDAWEDKLRDVAWEGNVTAIIVGLKMRNRFVERQLITVSKDDLMARLRELAPDMAEDEIEASVAEAMKLLAAPRGR